jgi:hypothetical protein
LSDVTGEISGTGYAPGGNVCASASVTWDSVSQEAVFDADDVAWPLATFTARTAVLYVDSPSQPLLGYVDFEEDKSVFNGTFAVTFDTSGVGALSFIAA